MALPFLNMNSIDIDENRSIGIFSDLEDDNGFYFNSFDQFNNMFNLNNSDNFPNEINNPNNPNNPMNNPFFNHDENKKNNSFVEFKLQPLENNENIEDQKIEKIQINKIKNNEKKTFLVTKTIAVLPTANTTKNTITKEKTDSCFLDYKQCISKIDIKKLKDNENITIKEGLNKEQLLCNKRKRELETIIENKRYSFGRISDKDKKMGKKGDRDKNNRNNLIKKYQTAEISEVLNYLNKYMDNKLKPIHLGGITKKMNVTKNIKLYKKTLIDIFSGNMKDIENNKKKTKNEELNTELFKYYMNKNSDNVKAFNMTLEEYNKISLHKDNDDIDLRNKFNADIRNKVVPIEKVISKIHQKEKKENEKFNNFGLAEYLGNLIVVSYNLNYIFESIHKRRERPGVNSKKKN